MMAPTNHRIVSFDDINKDHRITSPSRQREPGSFFASKSYLAPDEYCKSVGRGHGPPQKQIGALPLHTIPGLPQNDVCVATLERIHKEFLPIIKRRGFNVRSISELCCCGDGLDHCVVRGRKKGKCRRMSNNVLGYNQTTFGRIKSHSIHLRLRRPIDHLLLPWEDVAGTMAHELSHCVHQNHGPGFFKLMEEILEEHATIQIHGLSGPSFLRPANADAVRQRNERRPGETAGTNNISIAAGSMSGPLPQTGGYRLGGRNLSGKSRLLNEDTANGRKLGGVAGAGRSQHELRSLIANAAESRKRQMLRMRRMIERSQEPCVIEILDDDDDDDDDDSKNPSVSAAGKSQCAIQNRKRKRPDTERNDLVLSQQQRNASIGNHNVIDLTANGSGDEEWSCERCTFRNKGSAHCEMCLWQP